MNRKTYFDYIEEKLHLLELRVKERGKLNILDLHIHSENFYAHFFNLLFGWKLENLNAQNQNVEAIDLIDRDNKIILQVSATNTKAKIEAALKKNILKDFRNYNFKFVSIAKETTTLRQQKFENPYDLPFLPLNDIYDTSTIIKYILNLDIQKQEVMYRFIKLELGEEIDKVKFNSNLAAIINLLANENLTEPRKFQFNKVEFEIDRKINFNNLIRAKEIINDYKVHYGTVDALYSEYDSFGKNKSLSVLSSIKDEYVNQKNGDNEDVLYSRVVKGIVTKVQDSANYDEIPIDELELCVNILVVDAFIRCKIFENPNNYSHAIA